VSTVAQLCIDILRVILCLCPYWCTCLVKPLEYSFPKFHIFLPEVVENERKWVNSIAYVAYSDCVTLFL